MTFDDRDRANGRNGTRHHRAEGGGAGVGGRPGGGGAAEGSATCRERLPPGGDRGSQDFDEIVGRSESLRLTLTKIEHVASTNASVAVGGDGDGKGAVCQGGSRSQHAKGSPSGPSQLCGPAVKPDRKRAVRPREGGVYGGTSDRVGRFQLADGEPCFSTRSANSIRNCRRSCSGCFRKANSIGSGRRRRQVDVRVIAATNRDLRKAMEEGSFVRISTIGWPCFPSKCRRSVSARRHSFAGLALHLEETRQTGKTIDTIPKKCWTRWWSTTGRETFGNWRT